MEEGWEKLKETRERRRGRVGTRIRGAAGVEYIQGKCLVRSRLWANRHQISRLIYELNVKEASSDISFESC
jgi:hypothetical protein